MQRGRNGGTDINGVNGKYENREEWVYGERNALITYERINGIGGWMKGEGVDGVKGPLN